MQRRQFTQRLALTGLAGAAAGAGLVGAGPAAAQGAPREGTHFVRLSTPAPVSLAEGKKVEVVEFFWYGCPHCYAFEPMLEAWVKRMPADVAFRQVPVGFMAPHQLHQRMYYALEEMGALETLHRRIFAAIHQQGRRLLRESEIAEFASANGVDGNRLLQAMKGFGVSTKVNRAKQLTDAYKIDGVPSLGIHGRFYTAASMAGGHDRAIAVAEYLIQQARQRA